MNMRRLLLWLAGSAVVLVWAFPETENTYYSWTDFVASSSAHGRASLADIDRAAPNASGEWVRFYSSRRHELISEAHHGRIEAVSPADDEGLIAAARDGVRFSCWSGCERRTRILWQSSLAYTVLIALIAAGGTWALARSTPPE